MDIQKKLNEAIEKAVLEYYSDCSWMYSYEDQFVCVTFSQNESGKNEICDFCYKKNNKWLFDIVATDEQIKRMWEILDNTPYRPVEEENEMDLETALRFAGDMFNLNLN